MIAAGAGHAGPGGVEWNLLDVPAPVRWSAGAGDFPV